METDKIQTVIESLVQGKGGSIMRRAAQVILESAINGDVEEEKGIVKAIETLAEQADVPRDLVAGLVLHWFMQAYIQSRMDGMLPQVEIVSRGTIPKAGNC